MDRDDSYPSPPWVAPEVAKARRASGVARMEILWGICERLEREGDTDARIDWLKSVMSAADREGRFEYLLRAFGVLRQIYMSDGRYADLRDTILWHFKWVLGGLVHFAEVERESIARVEAEFEEFYLREKQALRPLWAIRCYNALLMGRLAEAEEAFETWESMPDTDQDDCPACVIDLISLNHMTHKRVAEAIEAVMPIVRQEVATCNDTPITLSRLLFPCMSEGKSRLAEFFYSVTASGVRTTPDRLAALGTQVFYATVTGRIIRAWRLAGVALRRCHESRSDINRFSVYRSVGAWAALMTMARQPFTLPAELLPRREGAEGPAAGARASLIDIAGACFAEAARLAELLDRRNGTEMYRERLTEAEDMIRSMAERAKAPGDTDPQR